jgi:hypothetical protein
VNDRRRHLRALKVSALPLVHAIARGDLDPDDDGVRQRCALEARALRRALDLEWETDDFFRRIHELYHETAARGVHLDVQAKGDTRRLSASTQDEVVATARTLLQGVRSGNVLLTVVSSDKACQLFIRGPLECDPARSPSATAVLRRIANSFFESDDEYFYVEMQWPSQLSQQ